MARIYRFARLTLSVDSLHLMDWSELAQAAGYVEQAHFTKEFKDFTGYTPTANLTLRRRFPAEKGSRRTAVRCQPIEFTSQTVPGAARSGGDASGDQIRSCGHGEAPRRTSPGER